MNDDYPHA